MKKVYSGDQAGCVLFVLLRQRRPCSYSEQIAASPGLSVARRGPVCEGYFNKTIHHVDDSGMDTCPVILDSELLKIGYAF